MINSDNKIVAISEVGPNKWNPKLPFADTPEGQKNFARVLKSLKKHGQIDPILVRDVKSGLEIVNGYHRYMGMIDLGWTEVEIKNLGKISDYKAKAIALATEDAKIPLDRIKVAQMVTDILGFDHKGIDDLPYDAEEAEAMKKLLEFDFDQFEDDGKEIEDDDKDYLVKIPEGTIAKWRKLMSLMDMTDDSECISVLIKSELLRYEKDNKA